MCARPLELSGWTCYFLCALAEALAAMFGPRSQSSRYVTVRRIGTHTIILSSVPMTAAECCGLSAGPCNLRVNCFRMLVVASDGWH